MAKRKKKAAPKRRRSNGEAAQRKRNLMLLQRQAKSQLAAVHCQPAFSSIVAIARLPGGQKKARRLAKTFKTKCLNVRKMAGGKVQGGGGGGGGGGVRTVAPMRAAVRPHDPYDPYVPPATHTTHAARNPHYVSPYAGGVRGYTSPYAIEGYTSPYAIE